MITMEPLSPELHIEFIYQPLPPDQVRWYSYKAAYEVKGDERKAGRGPRAPARHPCAAGQARRPLAAPSHPG